MSSRNEKLQELCREYLTRLKYMAKKHGLGGFVDATIKLNRQNRCEATEKEVQMLGRLCNEERVSRQDIPEILGKTYRQCCEDGDFNKVRKLPHLGIYSKLSVLLYKEKSKINSKLWKRKKE